MAGSGFLLGYLDAFFTKRIGLILVSKEHTEAPGDCWLLILFLENPFIIPLTKIAETGEIISVKI